MLSVTVPEQHEQTEKEFTYIIREKRNLIEIVLSLFPYVGTKVTLRLDYQEALLMSEKLHQLADHLYSKTPLGYVDRTSGFICTDCTRIERHEHETVFVEDVHPFSQVCPFCQKRVYTGKVKESMFLNPEDRRTKAKAQAVLNSGQSVVVEKGKRVVPNQFSLSEEEKVAATVHYRNVVQDQNNKELSGLKFTMEDN